MPVTIAENVFVGEGVTLEQYLKDVENKGGVLTVVDTQLSATSKNPVENRVITGELNKVFQSVSDGKALIASAITDKGVNTESDATFETMANNIAKISPAIVDTATPLIPAMTSDTTPQGIASASYIHPGRAAWWAFSSKAPNINTGAGYWYCKPAGGYLQYAFNEEVKVEEVTIYANGDPSNGIYTITVSSSNDGATYTDVAVASFEIQYSGQFLPIIIKLPPSFMRYIRFSGDKADMSLGMIQAYGTKDLKEREDKL